MKNISDTQQALVIQTVAKIPCEPARKPFLLALEKLLPSQGHVTDEVFLKCINDALSSFRSGQWHGDAQGAYPTDTSTLTLKEAADLYVRMIREVGAWSWPPPRPLTDEERKAKAAEEAERDAKLDALGIKTGSDRYLFESLCNGDLEMFKRRKAEDDAHRTFMSGGAIPFEMWEEAASADTAEIAFDPTQPPPAKPPVVEPPAPTLDDFRRAKAKEDTVDDEPPSPFFSDWGAEGKDNRGRPVSAYGEASEVLKRKGKRRGRLCDKMKVFFK